MRILVVCTGNTCRSPLGEAVLRAEAARQGIELEVGSAGTAAYDGAPASEGSYLVALEHGLDLSAHRARSVTRALVDEADLVLTMSRRHLQRVRDLGGETKSHLFAEYAPAGDGGAEIPDPVGQGIEAYRETHARLAELAVNVVSRLRRERGGT